MIQKKFSTKKQKSKFEEECYDASSLEETYELNTDDSEEESDEESDDNEEKSLKEDITSISVIITADKPKKRGPKPTRVQFYVEPQEFDDAIIRYYNTEHISDELALMINKIAHKLSYAPNFINYTYRDEMVGDAIVRMMKALIARKYVHSKGRNPFSYFTKIAFNAFRNRIKREKHAHETLQRYQEEIIMGSDHINFLKNKKSLYSYEDQTITEE